MCYYARRDFQCGDWKWGNMMERCPRQHRIGETCGAKLVHPDHIERRPESCKVCLEIDVKRRRLAKINENIARWKAEKGRFAALLEKAEGERAQLMDKIEELQSQRASVVHGMGRQASATYPSMLPAQPASQGSGVTSYSWNGQDRGYAASVPGQSIGYNSSSNMPARQSGVLRANMVVPVQGPGSPYMSYAPSSKR